MWLRATASIDGFNSAFKKLHSANNLYKFIMGTNDGRTNDTANSKKALLPGCGRPLNYIPKRTDPDYIGGLFKNALSSVDIEELEVA